MKGIPTDQILSTNHQEPKSDLVVDIALERLHMHEAVHMHDVSLALVCSKETCSTVDAYGSFNEQDFFVANLKPSGDRSILLVESNNAGMLLKGLGLTKHIRGGELQLHTVFDRKNGGTVAGGTLFMNEFTAIKTPLLGKVLTLASFEGIRDLLQGSGIQFEEFYAPFTLKESIINVSEARSSGSSIGITADGVINLNTQHIHLKGTIVPAYSLNQVLNTIPLIGDIITGGKDEGLIETTYKIEGPLYKPKTEVNPLAMITPGFLRGLFDIFPEPLSAEVEGPLPAPNQ